MSKLTVLETPSNKPKSLIHFGNQLMVAILPNNWNDQQNKSPILQCEFIFTYFSKTTTSIHTFHCMNVENCVMNWVNCSFGKITNVSQRYTQTLNFGDGWLVTWMSFDFKLYYWRAYQRKFSTQLSIRMRIWFVKMLAQVFHKFSTLITFRLHINPFSFWNCIKIQCSWWMSMSLNICMLSKNTRIHTHTHIFRRKKKKKNYEYKTQANMQMFIPLCLSVIRMRCTFVAFDTKNVISTTVKKKKKFTTPARSTSKENVKCKL